MKKFSLNNLTYKEVLIIKHALRDKVSEESEYLGNPCLLDGVRPEDLERIQKEHEEHKHCYKKVEEQVKHIQNYIAGKERLY